MARDESDKAKKRDVPPDTGTSSEGLVGDTGEDRNLTGSTTWRTLPDQGSEAEREKRAPGSGKEKERGTGNPPRTTTGPMTSPKFGSAGSGGAELEPGPERD